MQQGHGPTPDLIGPKLEEVFISSGRQFSLKAVLLLADQTVSLLFLVVRSGWHLLQLFRIEYLHDNNFIHRNIRPILFSFARAKECRDLTTYTHPLLKYKEKQNMIGTARYASVEGFRIFQFGVVC